MNISNVDSDNGVVGAVMKHPYIASTVGIALVVGLIGWSSDNDLYQPHQVSPEQARYGTSGVTQTEPAATRYELPSVDWSEIRTAQQNKENLLIPGTPFILLRDGIWGDWMVNMMPTEENVRKATINTVNNPVPVTYYFNCDNGTYSSDFKASNQVKVREKQESNNVESLFQNKQITIEERNKEYRRINVEYLSNLTWETSEEGTNIAAVMAYACQVRAIPYRW